MNVRWETVVALARDVDDDCAAGRKLDSTRVARLARAVLDFQQQLLGGESRPFSRPPVPSAPDSSGPSSAVPSSARPETVRTPAEALANPPSQPPPRADTLEDPPSQPGSESP